MRVFEVYWSVGEQLYGRIWYLSAQAQVILGKGFGLPELSLHCAINVSHVLSRREVKVAAITILYGILMVPLVLMEASQCQAFREDISSPSLDQISGPLPYFPAHGISSSNPPLLLCFLDLLCAQVPSRGSALMRAATVDQSHLFRSSLNEPKTRVPRTLFRSLSGFQRRRSSTILDRETMDDLGSSLPRWPRALLRNKGPPCNKRVNQTISSFRRRGGEQWLVASAI